MKTCLSYQLRQILGLIALCTGLSAGLRAEETAAAPLGTAVLDFQSTLADRKELGKDFADLLQVYLSLEEHLMLVERSQLAHILGEQELSMSGTVSPGNAARIGQLSGAKVLISGRIFSPSSQRVYFVARVISTETGRVFGEMVEMPAPAEEIGDAAQELAAKISKTIAENQSQLLAQVETREERLERLRAMLNGIESLPSVKVSIPEEHFGQFIPDPAAETEIKLTLQALGFTLVDDRADWTITGEAFSEFGSRRGNLVSCMARVEVRLQSREKVDHLVERQTSSGVALGENVAAKNALQNAGGLLVERLIPLMVE